MECQEQDIGDSLNISLGGIIALPAILSTFSSNRKEEKDKEVQAEPVLRKQNSSETPVDIYISLAGGVSVAM